MRACLAMCLVLQLATKYDFSNDFKDRGNFYNKHGMYNATSMGCTAHGWAGVLLFLIGVAIFSTYAYKIRSTPVVNTLPQQWWVLMLLGITTMCCLPTVLRFAQAFPGGQHYCDIDDLSETLFDSFMPRGFNPAGLPFNLQLFAFTWYTLLQARAAMRQAPPAPLGSLTLSLPRGPPSTTPLTLTPTLTDPNPNPNPNPNRFESRSGTRFSKTRSNPNHNPNPNPNPNPSPNPN